MSTVPAIEADSDELVRLVDRGSDEELRDFLAALHPADVAEVVGGVDPAERTRMLRIFRLLPPEVAGQVLAEVPENDRPTLLAGLSGEELVAFIGQMETDDAADILEALPPRRVRRILDELEDEGDEIRALLRYPAETAGGLMQRELVSVPEGISVAQATARVREQGEHVEEFHRVFVVDEAGVMKGAFSLKDLVLGSPDDPIESIFEDEPVRLHVGMDQEEVAHLFKKYDSVSLPVLDDAGALVGRVVVDDVVDVIEEEANEDILLMAGTSDEELLYSDRVLSIAQARLKWLLVTFTGELLNVALFSSFQVELQERIALMFFVPLLVATGGGVGNQTATITTRALALGRLHLKDIARPVWKEIKVGASLGAVLGLLLSVVSYLWFHESSISMILGLSMAASLTIAATMGAMTPLVFVKLGFDPALAAGPIVGVSNDIAGVLVYFQIAQALL